MRPLNSYVFIEPVATRTEVASQLSKIGLVIKESGPQGSPKTGYVRFIDPNLAVEFKVGDKVVFNEPMPDGFKTEYGSYIPVKEDKIIAIINETDS